MNTKITNSALIVLGAVLLFMAILALIKNLFSDSRELE